MGKSKVSKEAKDGAAFVAEALAAAALPGAGLAVKGLHKLASMVGAANQRVLERKQLRFARALLEVGSPPGEGELPPEDEVTFASVYQVVMLADEEAKTELGARLLASFRSGACPRTQRPVLVRLLRDLPLGAIHFLEDLERTWRTPVIYYAKGERRRKELSKSAYGELLHGLRWSITEPGDREDGRLAFVYRTLLINAGALEAPNYGENHPIEVPPPSQLGRTFLACLGLESRVTDEDPVWIPTASLSHDSRPVGVVEVRDSTQASASRFMGRIHAAQAGRDRFDLLFSELGSSENLPLHQFPLYRELGYTFKPR